MQAMDGSGQPAPNLVPVTALSRKWTGALSHFIHFIHFILSISTNNSERHNPAFTHTSTSEHSQSGRRTNVAEQVMLLP